MAYTPFSTTIVTDGTTGAGVAPAGFLRVTDEPTTIFYDPFDAALETTNYWTAPTTGNAAVAASNTTGTLSLGTGTTASGWSKLFSQASFKLQIPGWTGYSFALTLPDLAAPIANATRFWGSGTPAAVPTTAVPMANAVGFEIVDSKMYAVVYAGGTRTIIQDLSAATGNSKQPTDANAHRYIVQVRTDRSFWYIDGVSASTLVATSNFQAPQIQTLPISFVAVGGATPPATNAQIQCAGCAVWDTSKSSMAISDPDYAWRQAAVQAVVPAGTEFGMVVRHAGATPTGTNLMGKVSLSDTLGVNVPLRPDGHLRVGMEATALFYDTFESALDTTDRWTTGGTAPTSATGTLTSQQGTVALTVSSAVTKATFAQLGGMLNQFASVLQTDSALKTGCYRFAGYGIAAGSPTVAAPIQNGVGFEWIDTTGVLSGVVWSGGVRTQAVSLSTVQPLDAIAHRYSVYWKSSRAYFEIDNVQVGSIALPNPQVTTLPILFIAVNGAATVTPAALFNASFIGAEDTARNNQMISDGAFPWRKAQVDAAGRLATTARSAIVQQATSSLTALNQAQTFIMQGEAAMAVQIAGTWVGTVTFEASNDNTNWTTINAQRAGDNTITQTVVNTAGNDLYRIGVAGFLFVRSRCSAFTSGTIVVTSSTSLAAASAVLSASLPAGTNSIGKVGLADTVTPANVAKITASGEVLITDSNRVKQSVAIVHTGKSTVTNGADAATGGRWWIINPVGSAVLIEIRRVEFSSTPTAATAFVTSPRVTCERVTFTGTASGAQITPAQRDSTETAFVGSIRTASTGLTLTAGAVAYGFTVAPVLTAVGTAVPVLLEWEPAENGRVVLRAGQGMVIRQADGGTVSDTRAFAVNLAWAEYTVLP